MLATGGRWRASTGGFLALSNPWHVADVQSPCGHTAPMTQFALMPPALPSMLPDLRAVGGLCFGGISAFFFGGHHALLRFVSLGFFFPCTHGGPLRGPCGGCSPPKLPARTLLPPRRVLLGFYCFHVAPDIHRFDVQYSVRISPATCLPSLTGCVGSAPGCRLSRK